MTVRLHLARYAVMVLALLLAMLSALAPAWGQDLQPVPALAARVLDPTGTLSSSEKESLETKLSDLETSKGSQVVVLMVPTTQPEDIASYANRVANTWKIGRKDVGDGVLILVAKNDRKVRIEVAKALEGAIPDLAAKRIIDDAITPNFKTGAYAAGLEAAVDQVIARINGEALPAPEEQSGAGGLLDGFDWMDLALFLFFGVPIAGSIVSQLFGRKLGGLLVGGAAGAIAMLVTSSLLVGGLAAFAALVVTLFSNFSRLGSSGVGSGGGGWSTGSSSYGGSSSSSSSSDSFSSGGGGDFGGGGASGDW